jgi:hypothetical protein
VPYNLVSGTINHAVMTFVEQPIILALRKTISLSNYLGIHSLEYGIHLRRKRYNICKKLYKLKIFWLLCLVIVNFFVAGHNVSLYTDRIFFIHLSAYVYFYMEFFQLCLSLIFLIKHEKQSVEIFNQLIDISKDFTKHSIHFKDTFYGVLFGIIIFVDLISNFILEIKFHYRNRHNIYHFLLFVNANYLHLLRSVILFLFSLTYLIITKYFFAINDALVSFGEKTCGKFLHIHQELVKVSKTANDIFSPYLLFCFGLYFAETLALVVTTIQVKDFNVLVIFRYVCIILKLTLMIVGISNKCMKQV